jgi:hypothetical protein
MADEQPDRIPSALEEKPELSEWLDPVLEAFLALSRARPASVGMGGVIFMPIPASEALAMANAIGWPPLDFLRVIAEADALYVERINQRTK